MNMSLSLSTRRNAKGPPLGEQGNAAHSKGAARSNSRKDSQLDGVSVDNLSLSRVSDHTSVLGAGSYRHSRFSLKCPLFAMSGHSVTAASLFRWYKKPARAILIRPAFFVPTRQRKWFEQRVT